MVLDKAEPRAISVTAIIPAHNEAQRVSKVLETVLATPGVDKVILVDDGSTDNTAEVGRRYPNVQVERLERNRGKGGAMLHGSGVSGSADVLLFLDADLIGITPSHVEALIAPVVSGEADMSLGKFTGGRGATDLAQFLVPFITGQRAIKRTLFQSIPDLDSVGFGIEIAVTLHVKAARRPVRTVMLAGVTHPMKEEKMGFFRGACARMKMYAEMTSFTIRYFATGKAKYARRCAERAESDPAPAARH